jgi:hypothetical protein
VFRTRMLKSEGICACMCSDEAFCDRDWSVMQVTDILVTAALMSAARQDCGTKFLYFGLLSMLLILIPLLLTAVFLTRCASRLSSCSDEIAQS